MKKEVEGLQEIYRLIAQLTSMEDCFILYQHLKGLTITFPTKLLDPGYVKEYLKLEVRKQQPMTKKAIQQWALSFDYSERQIRRILKEVKGEVEKEQEQSLPYVSQWLEKRAQEKTQENKEE